MAHGPRAGYKFAHFDAGVLLSSVLDQVSPVIVDSIDKNAIVYYG